MGFDPRHSVRQYLSKIETARLGSSASFTISKEESVRIQFLGALEKASLIEAIRWVKKDRKVAKAQKMIFLKIKIKWLTPSCTSCLLSVGEMLTI